MKIYCLAQEHNTMSPPGLEPGLLHPEASALKPHFFKQGVLGHKINKTKLHREDKNHLYSYLYLSGLVSPYLFWSSVERPANK